MSPLSVEEVLYNMSVTNSLGAGRDKGFTETYRGVVTEVNLLTKVRLEIGVNEDFVARTVEAIKEGAKTDEKGDGVIFVVDIGHVFRIGTDEEGPDAMG